MNVPKISLLVLAFALVTPGSGGLFAATADGGGTSDHGLPDAAGDCSYDADGDGTNDLHWTGTDCVPLTLQAAIDHAAPGQAPGQAVLVPASAQDPPTPRRETITIDQNRWNGSLAGLTLCSVAADTDASFDPAPARLGAAEDCDPRPDATLLDAGGRTGPLVTIGAPNVTVQGVTLRWSVDQPAGPEDAMDPLASAGVHIEAPAATIERSTFVEIAGTPLEQAERTRTRDARGTGTAVLLANGPEEDQAADAAEEENQPLDTVLRNNSFANVTEAIALHGDTSGLDVDARLNHWGTPTCTGIPAKIRDEGQANLVHYLPPVTLVDDQDLLDACTAESLDYNAAFEFHPELRLVDSEDDDPEVPQFVFSPDGTVRVNVTLHGADGQERDFPQGDGGPEATLVLQANEDPTRFVTASAVGVQGPSATFQLPADAIVGGTWSLWVESPVHTPISRPGVAPSFRFSAFNATDTSASEDQSGQVVGQTPLVDDLSDLAGTPIQAPSAVSEIRIETPDGQTIEPAGLTTDDTLTLHARGYDDEGKLFGEVPVEWRLVGEDVGLFEPSTGPTTTLELTTPGSAAIEARPADGDVPANTTGTIAVALGDIDRLLLEDGQGQAITSERTLTTDQTLEVHAIGFDADGNRLGTTEVAWSTTGDLEDTCPTDPATSCTFQPSQANTTGQLIADHPELDGDEDAKTGTITVLPGDLDHLGLRIEADDGTVLSHQSVEREEPLELSADRTLALIAHGVDADGNPLGRTEATWQVGGSLEDTCADEPAEVCVLDPTDAATEGTVTAHREDLGVQGDASSPTISIQPGPLDHIRVLDGQGTTIGDRTLTADATLELQAQGLDAEDNIRGLIEADWSLIEAQEDTEHQVGTFDPSTGEQTTLDLTTLGKARIQAQAAGLTNTTGTIAVDPGELDRLHLEDGQSQAITSERTLTTDQSLEVNAIGSDADGNRLGPQPVNWSTTGNLSSDACPEETRFCLEPVIAGSEGTIQADHAELPDDPDAETPSIDVVAGDLDHVGLRITDDRTNEVLLSTDEDATDGLGITTDDRLLIEAVGFDADGNRLGTVEVLWSTTGDLENTCPEQASPNCTLDPSVADTSGHVHADHRDLADTDDAGSPQIDVSPGAVAEIAIEDPDTQGRTIDEETLTTDDTLNVTARGYDADGNLNGTVEATWTLAGDTIGVLEPGNGSTTTLDVTKPGTGQIEAAYEELVGTTGQITAEVGQLDHIQVETETGQPVDDRNLTTDDTLTVTARGYDADGNLRGPVDVDWTTDGTLDPVDTTTGQKTTFEPSTSDTAGRILADHSQLYDAADGATGNLTVGVGALDNISLIDPPAELTADENTTLVAQPEDADGNPRHDNVTWEIAEGTGTLDPVDTRNVIFHPISTGLTELVASVDGTDVEQTLGIQITVGQLHQVTLAEVPETTDADSPVTVQALPTDADGNARDDTVTYNLDSGPGTIDATTGTYTPAKTGVAVVNATADDSTNGSQTWVTTDIQVIPGAPVSVQIDAPASTVTAGQEGTLAYDVEAVDAHDNDVPIDPDEDVTWTVEDPAAGAFEANQLTPGTTAGTYTLTANLSQAPEIGDQVALTIAPGPTANVELSPGDVRLLTSATQRFLATPVDAFGNQVPTALTWSTDDPEIATVDDQGRLTPGQVGTANLTAAAEDTGATGTARIEVVDRLAPLDHATLSTEEATVVAGTTTALVLQVFDEEGQAVGGLEATYEVANTTVGHIGEDGFEANRPGTTGITANVADLTASTEVTVVPGEPATLKVRPTSVTLDPGDTVNLTVIGLDIRNNPVDVTDVAWTIEDPSLAAIDPSTGELTASDTGAGSTTVTATVGDLLRNATVHLTTTQAKKDTTTNVTSTVAKQTITASGTDEADDGEDGDGGVGVTSYSVGLSRTESGAKVNIQPPGGSTDQGDDEGSADGTEQGDQDAEPVESFTGARATIGKDASNVAINVEVQDGHETLAPDEVDIGDLRQVIEASSRSSPALFVSVTASEGGIELTSERLNEMVESMEVDLRIPVEFFEEHGLDPGRVALIEYSEGHRVQGEIPLQLLSPQAYRGAYNYSATLDQFSAFAALADPTASPSGGGGGGGGGAGSPVAEESSRTELAFQASEPDVVRFSQDLLLPLTGVSLDLEAPCDPCRLIVETKPDQPAGLPPGLQALDRFDLTVEPGQRADQAPSISGVTLTMALPTSQLGDTDPDRVILLHHDGTVWQPEDLTSLGRTGDLQRFTAEVGSLSPFLIALDTQAPSIHDPEPIGLVTTSITTLTARWSDNVAVDPATADLRLDGDHLGHGAGDLTATPDGLQIDLEDPIAPGEHTAQLTVVDQAGHEATRTWSFTVTCQAPRIEALSPANRATGVSPGATVAVDLDLDACPLTTTTLGIAGTTVDLDREGDRLTAELPSELVPGQEIEATLTIEDSQGNRIQTAWGFTLDDEALGATGDPGAAGADAGPAWSGALVGALAVVVALALSAMLVGIIHIVGFSLRRRS